MEATTNLWFDDLPVLGKLSAENAAKKLAEVGDVESAAALEAEPSATRAGTDSYGGSRLWPFRDKAWQHTSHAFGFINTGSTGAEPLPIHHAGNIEADSSLKNTSIKVSLAGLQAADYPGRGTHNILFDFYAQNQVPDDVEHLHFNSTYRVREGGRAAILGYPLFLGLNVGDNGLSFKCYTVNVKNNEDEAFLSFLESDVFRAGLKLAKAAQPAIAPFSAMAYNLTRSIAKRNRNVAVQEFHLGLDFSSNAMGARLAEGSYIAVQIPETLHAMWNWKDWAYDPNIGQIVNREQRDQLIPFNYIVFNVSRYE